MRVTTLLLLVVLIGLGAGCPGAGAGEGEGEGEGEGANQAELIASVCATFAGCGNAECPLGFRADEAPDCVGYRDALRALDTVLDEGGCDEAACADGACSFDDAFQAAINASIVCLQGAPGEPFPEQRGYRCSSPAVCGADELQLCDSGYAIFLNTDILFGGGYGVVDDTLTVSLEQILDPLVFTVGDDVLTTGTATFTRDDSINLGDCT